MRVCCGNPKEFWPNGSICKGCECRLECQDNIAMKKG